MSASDLAGEYDAVMAEVIAVAGGCSQDEQRSVGVVFDHISATLLLGIWLVTKGVDEEKWESTVKSLERGLA